jgi:hypothetical protein
MLNIFNYQENANQNFIEILPHLSYVCVCVYPKTTNAG